MNTLDLAHDIYRAFEARDGAALFSLMDPDFVGIVSAGLGLGETHRGPKAMLRVWAGVSEHFDVYPRADEILQTTDGRIIAIGRYVGKGRTTGAPIDAAFVHVLTVRGAKFVALQQVTDTASWIR